MKDKMTDERKREITPYAKHMTTSGLLSHLVYNLITKKPDWSEWNEEIVRELLNRADEDSSDEKIHDILLEGWSKERTNMTDKLYVTRLHGNEYAISLTRNGIWYVAYGTYTPDGLGGLDHAPNQKDIEVVGAAIDAMTQEEFAKKLSEGK